MSDPIYTVYLFHDRPIEGFTNFESGPHHFKCEFDDDAEEYGNVYCLTPICTAALQLVLESWQVWPRWNAAFRAAETQLDTHPALPRERARYDELKRPLVRLLRTLRLQLLGHVPNSFLTKQWNGREFRRDELPAYDGNADKPVPS